jgi:two-component system, LytTR family, sensor kinase
MKKKIDIKRAKFYIWTGLAFILLWMLIDLANQPGSFWITLLNNMWRAYYIVVINFIFFEYGLLYINRRKNIPLKVLLFILFLWGQFMLYSFGFYAWRYLGAQFNLYVPVKSFNSVMEDVSDGVPYCFCSLLFFGVAKHIYDHIQLKGAAQQLRIEKQEAELNYLKSQTNPHFLFNTLNNIYSLARDKSDLAPESILRLSKILRFMLYEAGGEFISVEKELKIISDYLALEQLRYDESFQINFNHSIDDLQQAIPPLLLMPLVENAFKHGISETREHPFIDIHLSVHHQQLTFVVKNSVETELRERSIKENIGLSNLRRQLELLYREYKLTVQQNGPVFTATLMINLASHV